MQTNKWTKPLFKIKFLLFYKEKIRQVMLINFT